MWMFKEFQLVVITRAGKKTRLLNVPLHQPLQKQLAAIWGDQYKAFTTDCQYIEFNAGYNPDEHERFLIENYKRPNWLEGLDSTTVENLDEISNHENLIDSIKGIAAIVRDSNGNDLILFQNFSRAQVIRPGRFLLLRNNTYESSDKPGLNLDGKLAALYDTRFVDLQKFPCDKHVLASDEFL